VNELVLSLAEDSTGTTWARTSSSTNHLPDRVAIGRDMVPHAALALTSRAAWLRGRASRLFARTLPPPVRVVSLLSEARMIPGCSANEKKLVG
jgi:hypothetical protein